MLVWLTLAIGEHLLRLSPEVGIGLHFGHSSPRAALLPEVGSREVVLNHLRLHPRAVLAIAAVLAVQAVRTAVALVALAAVCSAFAFGR